MVGEWGLLGGQICSNWKFFPPSGKQQLCQDGKRLSDAASCFQESKIKAGNILVNDEPDLGGLLQLSLRGAVGGVGDLHSSSSSPTFVC